MKLNKYIISILLCMISSVVFTQTTGSRTASLVLPIVTLLDIEPTGSITMNFVAPTEAGASIANPTANTTKWVNYTSAIAPAGLSRRVTASVNQTISGIDVKIQAAAASGSGGGTRGTSSGQVTLSTTATTIISGIGGAYTGTGANNGHQLTISLVVNNYNNISSISSIPIVITYTITE
ncbi:hypothetical protein CHRY9393_02716 [Chryseobacterium fistulae]|uniref:DUF4402 domain-containing protein n=2 Tax=Chryseobacterium fistulae TaxID=2675058 RepID=A0A6N4XYV2_9FLAO|nr:hypothetical protein CHRY9393_02716 [Chryseobacterium fistulae]